MPGVLCICHRNACRLWGLPPSLHGSPRQSCCPPALLLARLPARHPLPARLPAPVLHLSIRPPRPTLRLPSPPLCCSLQSLLSLIGATACVTFSYIFPGLLVLRCQKAALQRSGAVCLLVLGAAMAAIALYNRLAGRGGE